MAEESLKESPPEQIIKSRKRVQDHGEVFTPSWLVSDMCDLVVQECERIDSRFLEPACGDGNFLTEVLRRKLNTVQRLYGRDALNFEVYSILAVTSLYGVDLLLDNVTRCRERLYQQWEEVYLPHATSLKEGCCTAVKKILELNILCGDALSLRQVNGSPIVFTEWSLINKSKFQRREYELSALLDEQGGDDLFSLSLDGSTQLWQQDPDDPTSRVPAPKKEYPLIDYWRLS
ncbi:MAG: SAM-dependent DNA methyltransferase [Kiritimatiellae bacterium]|nr:SAM-dependent DNA methyltransferase [Kiritimatiellia bacterium]